MLDFNRENTAKGAEISVFFSKMAVEAVFASQYATEIPKRELFKITLTN